jgi:hypothetical protein
VDGDAVAPIVGARPGLFVTDNVAGVPLPHEFPGVTETFPAVPPNKTLIDVVFCPETIVDPPGTVQA